MPRLRGRIVMSAALRLAVATTLVAGALVASAGTAAADDTAFETTVATGRRPTTVLAASGTVVVTRTQETSTAGFTRWSPDQGATWQDWT
ncbi:MAG: hypothetical protein AAGC63_14125, partial [Propionicimonas sp.]